MSREVRLLLRYRRRDVWRWRLRRVGVVPLVALMFAAVGLVGVGGAQLGEADPPAIVEPATGGVVVLDCVAVDVVEVSANGRGNVSIYLTGAMNGRVVGASAAHGQWSGGPGQVTIEYTARSIEWSAVYGFCDQLDER